MYPCTDMRSVYGTFECAHHWLVSQLKGLKSLSLTHLPSSIDSTYELVRKLPVSLTSIELGGPGCLEVWFERGKRNKHQDTVRVDPETSIVNSSYSSKH
mgnify:CR=1 FL=1